MNILMIAGEVAPYAKTGGLGEVMAALPKAVRRLGHDVRVFMPRYGAINPRKYPFVPIGHTMTLNVSGEKRRSALGPVFWPKRFRFIFLNLRLISHPHKLLFTIPSAATCRFMRLIRAYLNCLRRLIGCRTLSTYTTGMQG